MQKLTLRQKKVLDFIRASIDENGYPPTLREIGTFMGIRSTNGVNDHLRALERKGYLTRKDMKSRTLRPVHASSLNGGSLNGGTVSDFPANDVMVAAADRVPSNVVPMRRDAGSMSYDDNVVEIPILGRVAAGLPIPAIEHAEDSVRIDRMLIGTTRDVFGLRIHGESMIDAGILDGDFVFVRKKSEASRGEIVVALIGDEATCKYYYPERDHVRLEPANKKMAPILVHKSEWKTTQVLGVVVGVYRRM